MKTDETIQRNVMDELRWEPALHASEIGVAVKNGIVTLTGEVENYSSKLATERAAKRVQGVKVVVQEVQVKPTFDTQHTDQQIGQAIVNAFQWHSDIPADNLKAKVQDGWVTLEGNVNWQYQRKAAEWAVEALMGVKEVTNKIEVKPQITAKDIKDKIVEAFHRSAALDAEQIIVEASGNKVTLSGKVHSWNERREAENTAWAAPGVQLVEDSLLVVA